MPVLYYFGRLPRLSFINNGTSNYGHRAFRYNSSQPLLRAGGSGVFATIPWRNFIPDTPDKTLVSAKSLRNNLKLCPAVKRFSLLR